MPSWRVEMDQKSLDRFLFAIKLEEDGKAQMRDFRKHMRRVAQPATKAAQAAIRSMPSDSARIPHLRAGIARALGVRVRAKPVRSSVAIVGRKTPELRGFAMAPRRTNRAKGWRHPVFGNRHWWVHQMGKPGWFDITIKGFTPDFLRAAKQVMDDMARRISRRTKG